MNTTRFFCTLLCALTVPAAGAFAAAPMDNWTPITVPAAVMKSVNDMIHANGEFWAIGTTGRVQHSANGHDWQVVQTPTNETLVAIVHGHGRFVAAGFDGLLMSSPDGLDWTIHEDDSSGAAPDFADVIFADGRFVAVGDGRRVRVSVNGTEWTPATLGGTSFTANAVAWGHGRYVAVGTGSFLDQNGVTRPANVQTSPDGLNWTPHQIGLGFPHRAVAFFHGRFISGEFHLASSPDGLSWSPLSGADFPHGNMMTLDLKILNGRLFAFGTRGLLASSPDGVEWSVHNTGTTQDILAADYDGGRVLTYRFGLTASNNGPATSDPWAPVSGGGDPDDPSGPAAASQIANISTRAWVGSEDTKLITGFIVSGSMPKQVLIRGIGPTLAGFGVSGTLADPLVTLFDGTGQVLASNNDWGTFADQAALAAETARVFAFNLAAGSKDAAMLVTLQPGLYTLHTSGADGGTGVALAEVYDCASEQACRLVNISSRGYIGLGDNVAIPGFIVAGDQPKKLLVRGVGPTLSTFGVPGTIADPQITLFDAHQTAVAANDNWGTYADQAELAAATAQVFAFALTPGSTDAAMIVTVNPGLYTAVVAGHNHATGVALVEVYEIE